MPLVLYISTLSNQSVLLVWEEQYGICFGAVLSLYGSGVISLTTLIQFPNATFILTYLGGCAAGIRLLKGSSWGVGICWLSFLSTAVIFPFVGWAVLYPLVIIAGFWITRLLNFFWNEKIF